MPYMNEMLVNWTLPSGGTHVSVFYFDDTPSLSSQRTALAALMANWASQQVTGVQWSQPSTGRVIDPATGTLVGSWSSGSVNAGTGTQAGQQVADATQALVQWRTAAIVNGRFVRGRQYVPGLYVAALTGGNLTASVQTVLKTGAANMVGSGAGLVVWHRPGPLGAGSAHLVNASDVWRELAVLRRRRG